MSKKTAYFFYPNDGACNYHRVLQPARFCNDRYESEWDFLVGPGPSYNNEVYYYSGLPNIERAQNTLIEIQHLRRKGAKFVWSVDDDWLSIPDWNPAKQNDSGLATYGIMKEIADYIIVSTPALAATFSDVKDKVLVAPNLLDLSMYPEVASEEFTDSDGKKGKYYDIKVHTPVRVVWVGSETHRGDVDEITEGLDEFLAKYCGLQNGNKAVVIFSGMLPHGNIVRKYLHKGLLHQPMVPFVSYHQVLTSIQPHVYLAPLASIPFNQAKSNLRVIEGMALCAPSVASSWGEYETTIKDGVDGVLSYTPDSFYSKLVEVVTDPEYRVSLASHGRMKVETQYNWAEKKCRQAWYNVFDKILGYTG